MHLDLVVPRTQVYLREELSSSKLIHQLVDLRNGVLVLRSLLIEGLVVNAHPQRAVFLLH